MPERKVSGLFPPSMILKRLIRKGTLTVIDPKGRQFIFSGKIGPSVTIRLKNNLTTLKLAIYPQLYLGEAFMDGTLVVENGDIYDFLNLLTLNLGWREGTWFYEALSRAERLIRRLTRYNPIPKAKLNVAHHYDLNVDFYRLFLDDDLQYSCAYFTGPYDSLEKAQERKKHLLGEKLYLEPGQRVLDIGCGWGGLAFHLHKNYDVSVTGITLSEEQLSVSLARVGQDGFGKAVEFRRQDYREIKEQFDRIVSVGMFEHVGVPHYRRFFRVIKDSLTDDGVALLHTIGRADGPGTTNTWLYKYIFPGGYIPALSEIIPEIEKAGLYITDIEILRLHYAKTLNVWRQRFLANINQARALYDERFCRMWEFYLACSEVAFRNRGNVVFQIQLAKRQDAVPLTRAYLSQRENQEAQRGERIA